MDPMAEDDLRAVADRLDAGLYVQNLHGMLEELGRTVRQARGPEQLAVWVVESVVADLRSDWEPRTLPTAEYDQTNGGLTPVLRDVIDCLLEARPEEELYVALQRLVSRFLELESSRATA